MRVCEFLFVGFCEEKKRPKGYRPVSSALVMGKRSNASELRKLTKKRAF